MYSCNSKENVHFHVQFIFYNKNGFKNILAIYSNILFLDLKNYNIILIALLCCFEILFIFTVFVEPYKLKHKLLFKGIRENRINPNPRFSPGIGTSTGESYYCILAKLSCY